MVVATAYDQSTAPQATAMGNGDQLLGSPASGGSTMNYTRAVVLTGKSGEAIALQNSTGAGSVTVNSDGSIVITPATGKTVTITGLDIGSNLAYVHADATNATNTLANLPDLSQPVVAGHKYVGRAVFKCVNSTAGEGIQFDFGGGSATATTFWAGAGILASGGTDVVGTNIATSLTGAVTFTTFTGESVVTVEVFLTANAGGTIVPRFSEASAHIAGTATVRLGSSFELIDVT